MEENLHQLRLAVYPMVYRILYIPGGGFLPSTVGRRKRPTTRSVFFCEKSSENKSLLYQSFGHRLRGVIFIIYMMAILNHIFDIFILFLLPVNVVFWMYHPSSKMPFSNQNHIVAPGMFQLDLFSETWNLICSETRNILL